MTPEIFEKNPQNVQVIWPMSGGVIANLTEMEIVLSSLLKHFSGAFGSDASLIYSSTERNHTGGAQSIFPRHERKNQRRQNPADRQRNCRRSKRRTSGTFLRGIWLPISEPIQLKFLSFHPEGDFESDLKDRRRRLDEDICTMVRRKFNLSIGRKTAESLKTIWLYDQWTTS